MREKYGSRIRKQYGISEKEFVLLFVGSSFERKGLPLIIRSLRKICKKLDQAARLVVIGEGNIQKYEALAERLGCRKKILFIGSCYDPQPWYGAADLFVLPTIYDACSSAVLEALACGIPVITTRFNGASEIVEKKECGVILENPRDREAFTSAVVELFDEKKRQKMALEARKAVTPYSVENFLKNTVRFYHEIA